MLSHKDNYPPPRMANVNSKHIESGVTIWRCPGCGFGMASEHTSSDRRGLDQWECPLCGTTDDGDGHIVVTNVANGA